MRRREFIGVMGGAALAWPLVAGAEQSRLPLVGILRVSPKDAAIFLGPFRRYMHGAKPAELPIEQPFKFELIVNLKAAGALGLTIPSALLLRSDEVID